MEMNMETETKAAKYKTEYIAKLLEFLSPENRKSGDIVEIILSETRTSIAF